MVKNKKCYSICELINHAKIAGTEKHLLLLVSNLNNINFNSWVCTFENGDLIKELLNNSINTKIITQKNRLIHFFKLVKFLKYSKFDLIHSHSGGYACLAGKFAGIKRILYTKHGVGLTQQELDNLSFKKKITSLIVDKCTKHYIALTQNDKNTLVKYFKINPNKISVIPNGIDISFINEVKKRENNNFTIGTVTRLMPQKGLKYFIKAIPEILKFNSDISFKIAGTGKQKRELESLAKNLKISYKLEFSGYLYDIANFINNLDIFILPSLWEGFPYVLLEAMILKKPIISTDIFGINEIIEHSYSGILVKPYQPKQISEAAIDLIKNPKFAKSLGENAYKKVTSEYTLTKNIEAIESLYLKVLK